MAFGRPDARAPGRRHHPHSDFSVASSMSTERPVDALGTTPVARPIGMERLAGSSSLLCLALVLLTLPAGCATVNAQAPLGGAFRCDPTGELEDRRACDGR
jgi:hypothetical protein